MSSKKIIVLAVVVLCGILLIMRVFELGSGVKKTTRAVFDSRDSFLPSTFILPGSDSLLFTDSCNAKLKVDEIWQSKVRGSISFLSYQDSLHFIVYKIPFNKEVKLSRSITTYEEMKGQSMDLGYRISYYGDDHEFGFAGFPVGEVSKIYLSREKGFVRNLELTDSTYGTYLRTKSLSIKYVGADSIDLSITPESKRTQNLFTIFIFFKRVGNYLNVILVLPKVPNDDMPINKVINLIRK